MKFGRALHGGVARAVLLRGEQLFTLEGDGPLPSERETGESFALAGATMLSPVVPGKVVCVGRNYRAHARELGNEVPTEPLLFMKPPSGVTGPGAYIVLPPESARVEHEGELAVVIGRRIRRASPAQARAAIFGYTVANDVTARDLQKRDVQFTRAKGYDTFCPLGPWIETGRPEPDAVITVRVNGATRQRGALADMVFGIDELVAFISIGMTLEPGDVVLTGTPEGVGPLAHGDTVEVEIASIGVLSNPVRTESAAGAGG